MYHTYYQLQDYIERKGLGKKQATWDDVFAMLCFLNGDNNKFAPDEEFTTFYMKDKFGNDLDRGIRLGHSVKCIVYKQLDTKEWLVKDKCLRWGILTYEQNDCIGIYPHIETITEEKAMRIMGEVEKKEKKNLAITVKMRCENEGLKEELHNLIDKYL